MKKARLILWLMLPVAIAVYLVLILSGGTFPPMLGNIMVSVIFLIPITAMLLQTIMNKEKNTDNNIFVFKLVFVICLYVMVAFMFASTTMAIMRQ